jgi:predicted nucleic acid-binding Zn ribbon protein
VRTIPVPGVDIVQQRQRTRQVASHVVGVATHDGEVLSSSRASARRAAKSPGSPSRSH